MTSTSIRQAKLVSVAINEALECDMQSKHGCVLAHHGKVISTGTNHYRTCVNGQQVVSCHAEIEALYKYIRSTSSQRQLSKLDLWVVRVSVIDNQVTLRESFPCSSCLNTLKQYGIRKIWYSDSNGQMQCSKVQELENSYVTRWNQQVGLYPTLKLERTGRHTCHKNVQQDSHDHKTNVPTIVSVSS